MTTLFRLRRALFLRRVTIALLCLGLLGCGDSTSDEPPPPDPAAAREARLQEIKAKLEALGTDTGPVTVEVPEDGPPKVEGAAQAAEEQPLAEGLGEVHSLATFKDWFKKRTGQDWDGFVASARGAKEALDASRVEVPSADGLKQSIGEALETLGGDANKLDAVNGLLEEVTRFDEAAGVARDGVEALKAKTMPVIGDVDSFIASVEALGEDNWPKEKVEELQKKNFVDLVKNLETLHNDRLPELAETARGASDNLEEALAALRAKYDEVASLLPDKVREEAERYISEGQETVDEVKKVLGALGRVAANSELIMTAFQAHPALGIAVALLLFALEYFGDGGGPGSGPEEGPQSGASGNEGVDTPTPPTTDGNTEGLPEGSSLARPEASEPGAVVGSYNGSPWFMTWFEGDVFGIRITAEGQMSATTLLLKKEEGNAALDTIFERLQQAKAGEIAQIEIEAIAMTDGSFPVTVTFKGVNSDGSSLPIEWSASDAFEVKGTVR